MKSKLLEGKFAKTYFRVFPSEAMVWDYVKILDDHKTVYIRCLQELTKSKECIVPTFWTFQTERVFYNETQQEIYNFIMPELLINLTQGLDVVVVAYGQTGTGKSLTMSGAHNSYDDRGILLRVIPELFKMKSTMAVQDNRKMCIQVSFIEISKTVIHDLLKSYPNTVNSIKEIAKIKPKDEDDALKIIFKGEGRKEYFEDSSYASHAFTSICTFYITVKYKKAPNEEKQQCKLHIIDFAGADTIGNFSCLFKKPQEVGSANLAKTQLEQFFLVLSSNIPQHVKAKYRLNTIIQYLGDSLSSSSVLRFIGHIKISRENLLITISMLRFGQLVGGIKCAKHKVNINNNDINADKIRSLQKELNKLNAEKQYDSKSYLSLDFNAERYAHVERMVREYLQDEITELTVLNVCEIKIALEVLKMMCKKYEDEKIKAQSKTRVPSDKQIVRSKSSRISNKSSNNSLLKKINDEKIKAPSRSLSAPLKSTSPIVTKASGSSLLRRSLTGKRNTSNSQTSSVSKEKRRSKMDSVSAFMDLPPDYNDAWNMYKIERKDVYENFQTLHQKYETELKNSYKTYMDGINSLREIMITSDKIKSDLVMVEMTRQLQNTERRAILPSNLEQCLTDRLKSVEKEQIEKREIILTNQAMFKVCLDACKQARNDLKMNFDQYCKEKYQMPLVESPCDEILMNIEHFFQEEENDVEELLPDNSEIEKFKQFQQLIASERRKKKTYQLKHREWTVY